MSAQENTGLREWISENFLRTPGTVMIVMVASVFAGVWLFTLPPAKSISDPSLDSSTKNASEEKSEVAIGDRFFQTNDAALTPRGEQEVRTLASAAGPKDSYLIIGYADRRPSSKMSNTELSRRRAAAVEAVFRERGVKQTRTLALGATEASLCPDRAESCLEKDRRVEVWRRPAWPSRDH